MHNLSKARFRALFVAIPLLASSIVPTMIFGLVADQWGTNLLWGSYFGLGWCLSAFWTGGIFNDHLSTAVGLIWGWLALMPLYFAAGWLWERTTANARRIAVGALLVSAVLMVPAKAVMDLDQRGIHLPDYASHLATSF
ncbi:hypothetical protein ACX40Y_06750 [Sphingomonas sp. RS6]